MLFLKLIDVRKDVASSEKNFQMITNNIQVEDNENRFSLLLVINQFSKHNLSTS